MGAPLDLVGQKFNRWTVQQLSQERKGRERCWDCICECGALGTISTCSLTSGNTKSCGCLNLERIRERNYKHGHCVRGKRTRTNRIWLNLTQRTRNVKNPRYGDYGGRGIIVCDRWLDYRNFLEDMGEAPKGKSLERRDNDGIYCRENCYWATPIQQGNNKRNNVLLTAFGETKTLAQWSRDPRCVIGYNSLYDRVVRNGQWNHQEAMTSPPRW